VLHPESTIARIQVTDQVSQVHVFVCMNCIINASCLLIVTQISRYLDLFVSSNHQNIHSGCCVRFPRLRNSFQAKLLIQISSSHALSRMYVFNGKDLGLKENKHVLHNLAHLQIISMFLLFVKKN